MDAFYFISEGRDRLGKGVMGRDCPVVYLINNDSEMHIGETCSVYNRFSQHLQNLDHNELKTINVFIDDVETAEKELRIVEMNDAPVSMSKEDKQ